MALSDTAQVLADATQLLRERYFDDQLHESCRPRRGISDFVRFRELTPEGETLSYQVLTQPYTGSRVSTLEGALPTPSKITGKKVVINLGKSTSDLTRLTAGVEYSWEAERIYRSPGSVLNDIVEQLSTQMIRDFKERVGQMPWLGSSNKLAEFDGAAEDTDGTTLSGSATDFRFKVKDGSPNFFIPNLELYIYAADDTTLLAGSTTSGTVQYKIRVTDVKPDTTTNDWYVYVQVVGGNIGANQAAFVTDCTVYRSGEKGVTGPYGFNDWFHLAADGGVDDIFHFDDGTAIERDKAENGWFLPLTIDAGSSALNNFDVTILDRLWPIVTREVGDTGAPNGLVLVGDPEMWQNVKRNMEVNKRTILPMDQATKQIFGVDGASNLYFIDPIIGQIALANDVYAPKNKLRLINPAQWGYIKTGTAEFLPNPAGGYWFPVDGYAAYKAYLIMLTQMFCMAPRVGNYEINKVRSTNV